MNKTTVQIKGMHYHSCELLIEDELMKISCVKQAVVSQQKGIAEIYFTNHLSDEEVQKAVKDAGYELGVTPKNPLFSKNPDDYIQLAGCGIILMISLFFANEFGLFELGTFSKGNYS